MLSKKQIMKKTVAAVILVILIVLEFFPITNNIVWAADNPEDALSVKGYFSTESGENVDSLICDIRRK